MSAQEKADYQDLLRRLTDAALCFEDSWRSYDEEYARISREAIAAIEALLKELEELRGEVEALRENSGVVFYEEFDESVSDTPPPGGWDKPI